MSVLVIIPAAGSGTRFGGDIPKQFQPIAGKPMVQYVVERFLLSGLVERIVVAVSEALLTTVRQAPGDRVQFVAGGETRQQSVMNAFKAAGEDFDVVAVHDAVRPFFRMPTFEALLDAAREFGGALPALPLIDTIHATRDGRLAATVDRTNLVAAQTPQVFRYDVLRDALERAIAEGFDGTDEAGVAARYGYDVRVVAGDPHNIKITRPEDLALAQTHFEEWSSEG
ncbi:MAG TPA: 2-C-methyl-D-erythritol 4-phosphate cytidylyltransferase [Thermoanaerobaculia bacterium]|nr:2-C-methyl-D-erythritol 4-phosphate cytidylyltransferase [Thermoanaerobaculia bacterium]